jgi:microcystin degradation protein MlrC
LTTALQCARRQRIFSQCFCPSIFTDLGINPRDKQVLVPKSYQHFYGAFAPLAAEIIYMAAPGAVTPDPRRNPYQHLDTSNLYPWVPEPVLMDS